MKKPIILQDDNLLITSNNKTSKNKTSKNKINKPKIIKSKSGTKIIENKNLNKDEEVCSICLGDLYDPKEQIYELPECGHRFHTNCIMHWMRNPISYNKCPRCGNTGVNKNVYLGYCRKSGILNELKKFSKRKSSPKVLKNDIERLQICIKKIKEKEKNINKIIKDKELKKLKREKKSLTSKKYTLESKILSKYNFAPIIISKRKIIYEKKILEPPINSNSIIGNNNIGNQNSSNSNNSNQNNNISSQNSNENLNYFDYDDDGYDDYESNYNSDDSIIDSIYNSDNNLIV